MRIRYKKWARPELEASKFYIDEPEKMKGKWKTFFKNPNNPLHLELGCGKGQFISNLASENLDKNYIAIDLVDAMLGLAKRNVEQVYTEKNMEPENIVLTRYDIERILQILDKEDKIERIYTCGPKPMMKIVAETAVSNGIDCQVSMEERMGCGVGACVTCTCTLKDGSRKRVCKDGPIFNASEVDFDG